MSLKILELCLSSGYGGLELYVNKVTNYFSSSEKYDVLTILKKNSFLDQRLDSNKIVKKYLKTVNRHLPVIAAFQLAKIIDKEHIDIIHIHWGKDLFLAVLAKVFCKIPVKLIYMRQMALTRFKNDFYHKFLYKNIDAYHVITKELQKEAIKFLPLSEGKIKLLYYGVPAVNDNNVNCNNFMHESGIKQEYFKVAIFGRIEQGKGQHLVIEAAKKLISQGEKIQVAIIGHVMDKEYYKQLEKSISENRLKNNILFLGFHKNPTSIMPCFDAVILASECETFGLVLPEAMRAGVTVLGSKCGGVPEIITHDKTGLLFESGNIDDLTEQLKKIIVDKSFCNKLASLGKIDADDRFSEEKHFDNLTTLFNTV